MKVTQVTASDKRPCGVRSQRNLRHGYRRLVAGLVFVLPTHVVVTSYSHGFGRNHRWNRDSVLDRGREFCALPIFQTALRRCTPIQSLPALPLRETPSEREAENPPTSST